MKENKAPQRSRIRLHLKHAPKRNGRSIMQAFSMTKGEYIDLRLGQ